MMRVGRLAWVCRRGSIHHCHQVVENYGEMTKPRHLSPVPDPTPSDAPDWDPGNVIWPVSTTWRTRRGKITRAPQATQDSGGAKHRLSRMPRRDPRTPLQATLKLRGGAEAWVEIHARGAVVRVPGHTSIAELVLLLNSHV